MRRSERVPIHLCRPPTLRPTCPHSVSPCLRPLPKGDSRLSDSSQTGTGSKQFVSLLVENVASVLVVSSLLFPTHTDSLGHFGRRLVKCKRASVNCLRNVSWSSRPGELEIDARGQHAGQNTISSSSCGRQAGLERVGGVGDACNACRQESSSSCPAPERTHFD